MFQKATKEKVKLRLALVGPTGSGKTYTALRIAAGMGKRIAVIDSENGSASRYADRFDFDVCDMPDHNPETYVKALQAADAAGYDVVIVDSLSHAWMGREGALEQVDKAAKRSKSGNSFTAWRDVTPMHNRLVDALLQCQSHLIVTMRAKTEYVMQERTNGRGKTVQEPVKVGLAPVQRDGVEYEFDVVADIDVEHTLTVSKTRCAELDGYVGTKPGEEFAETLRQWTDSGADRPAALMIAALKVCNDVVEMEGLKTQAKREWSAYSRAEREQVAAVVKSEGARVADNAERANQDDAEHQRATPGDAPPPEGFDDADDSAADEDAKRFAASPEEDANDEWGLAAG